MAPLDRIDPIIRSAAPAHERSTMRVRMTENRTAALDGINATTLTAGEEYDLPDHLADRYIEVGAAEAARKAEPGTATADEPPADDAGAKADEPDLEDRAAGPPPENKPAPKRSARARK